jgi:putative flippase GtrA
MRAGSAHLTRQFGKFLVVGVSNTALSFLVYAGLVAVELPYIAAGAAGFAAGAVNGYVLNRRWTFRRSDSTGARVRYLAVQAAGLAATSALLWLLAGSERLGSFAGYLVTVPIVTVAMFVANRNWTFGPAPALVLLDVDGRRAENTAGPG